MEKLNSYLGIARNDYLYAKNAMSTGKEIGNFNGVAALCAQSGEKYLKAVIEKCFVDDGDVMDLLHSHNLRSLYNKIITKFNMNVSSKDCKWLGDFYFDARYPGDNFVTVNEEDAQECLRIVELLETDVRALITEEEAVRGVQRQKLRNMAAFKD